jgi:hypothetical protein
MRWSRESMPNGSPPIRRPAIRLWLAANRFQ